jgi:hypothetical protein
MFRRKRVFAASVAIPTQVAQEKATVMRFA